MYTMRRALRRIGLPIGIFVLMVSMLGFLFGPSASAQTGYPPPTPTPVSYPPPGYPPPPDQIVSISGRVVDSVTKQPVTGYASITLNRCDLGFGCFFVSSAFLNLDGTFRFISSPFAAPLYPGTYYVNINVVGYGPLQSATFSGALGENVVLSDLAIIKAPAIGGIQGILVDASNGQPIPFNTFGTIATLYRCVNNDCSAVVESQTLFNSQFNFVSGVFGRSIAPGNFIVEISSDRYETLRTAQFSVAVDETKALGNLAITPLPSIGSISGQIVDSVTGGPVPGVVDPGTQVLLTFCPGFGCFFTIANQSADAQGRFRFDRDFLGRPLLAGRYLITVNADQYYTASVEVKANTANENRDLGKVKIQPFPVRFTDIRGCGNIPASGGTCQYSLRVTSGMTTTIDAATWSIASVFGTFGSVGNGPSTFQTDQAQSLRLKPGQSQVIKFQFRVPAAVPANTAICTSAYVSSDKATRLFSTIGFRSLFCITKTSDTGGFRQMTDRERRDFERKQSNSGSGHP